MDRLKKAEEHFFSTGLNDVSAQLAQANTTIGLAKIQFVQEQLGYPADATFISAPDLCISKNIQGWEAGFGYGGTLIWGGGNRELIVLDPHPNGCGILVGGIENPPKPRELLEKAEEIMGEEKPELDGIEIEWDLGRRNHFIRVDKVENLTNDWPFPPYSFIVHCSARELKKDTVLGHGLYHDQSEILQERLERFDTPFGPLHVLTGKYAREFTKQHAVAKAFGEKRRRLLAELLFGEYTEIVNRMHQGLVDMNRMVLGAQTIVPGTSNDLYPIMFRGDLPISFLKVKNCLTKDQIEKLGFGERARKLGIEQYMENVSIMPHGGGYRFTDIKRFVEIIEIEGGERYFCLEYEGGNQIIIPNLKWVAFGYRGEEVLEKLEKIGGVERTAQLHGGYTIKV